MRWITPIHSGVAFTSQTFTAARVRLAMFDLGPAADPIVVDGVTYIVGDVSAGEVTAGVYGPVSLTADAPDGSSVIVESSSVAQAAPGTLQHVSFSPTSLRPGVYYVALEGSDATGTYLRQSNQRQAPGITGYYDRAGGYGALTSPCPAMSESGVSVPGMRIRVAA